MAANLVMAIHAAMIVAVFVGIGLSIKYKRYRPWEALVLLSAVVIWSVYGACPLTVLEDHFREIAGAQTNVLTSGFIPYYLQNWFGLEVSGQTVKWVTYGIGAVFLLLSIEWEVVYMRSFRNSPKPKVK